jgi:O-antigen ligase
VAWVDKRSKLVRLLYLIVVTGTSVSIIGLVQRMVGAEKIYGFWKPLFRGDASFFGPYVNPNHFAGYMALVIPIAVILFIRAVERLDRYGGSSASSPLGRSNERSFQIALFLLLGVFFMVSGLFASLSRGGLLALGASMIFLVVALSFKGGWRWVLGLGVLGGLFGVLFLFWLGFAPFQARVETLTRLFQDPNMHFRLQVWKDTGRMLRDFPLFGTGLGTFAHAYPRYKTVLNQVVVMYPESDFLQVLTETGLVGAGACVWLLVAFFRALWIRSKRSDAYMALVNPKVMVGLTAAMVAMLMHGFGDFNLHIPANALCFTVIMGLAITVKLEKTKVAMG